MKERSRQTARNSAFVDIVGRRGHSLKTRVNPNLNPKQCLRRHCWVARE